MPPKKLTPSELEAAQTAAAQAWEQSALVWREQEQELKQLRKEVASLTATLKNIEQLIDGYSDDPRPAVAVLSDIEAEIYSELGKR